MTKQRGLPYLRREQKSLPDGRESLSWPMGRDHGRTGVKSMWQAERSALQNGVQQLTLRRGARSLTMAEVCRLWQADDGFCAFFSGALAEAPYAAVFWELPPLTERNLHRPFECILA
ncbi:MAG TPA: hypothetical protein VKN76_18595, partial [Kiloniellaceae bacterium]|nr:hypothetical protein [Kiloniellaceae bacterium]